MFTFRDIANKSKELSKLKLNVDEQIEMARQERECLNSYQVIFICNVFSRGIGTSIFSCLVMGKLLYICLLLLNDINCILNLSIEN